MRHFAGAFGIACVSALTSGAGAAPSFVDRSENLPVRHLYSGGWAHFVGGGVAVFDCNRDGRADLFSAGGSEPSSLFVNVSDPSGDITFALGDMKPLSDVIGAYPLDVDNDGLPDLMVLRNGANRLLKGGEECSFTDITAEIGLPEETAWSTAFSAWWEQGNSLPTLAIGNYVDATDPKGPFGTCDTNWLLRPDGPRYGAALPLEPSFCALSMLFSDWQRNGTPMLRVSNDRQYYVRDGYEQMWRLDPLQELTKVDGWPALQLWGMGIASRDISGDGLADVMLTSMGDQMLMENTGNGFATVPYTKGTFAQRPFIGDDGRASTGWHAEFGDIDNDGRADLFIAKGNVDQMPDMAMADPNNLLMQQPDGSFVEMADKAGVASVARGRGAGLVDLNNDGLLDIVVVNRRAPMEIWQNATPDAGNFVAVQLSQSGTNSFAIGSVVELRSDDIVQTQEITVGGGHASGQLLAVHFGIGAAQSAEIRVTWPDGVQSGWQPVVANRKTHLTR